MDLRRFAILFSLVALLLPPALLNGADPILPSDLIRIQRVTEVRLAPDSSFVVYGVQSIHVEPGKDGGDPVYSYRTHLWLADLANATPSAPVQLTFGDRNDTNFEIGPDGKTLAFVRVDKTQPKPKPQVWLLPLHGPGEAHELTHLEFGAASPEWRPDGKALLVTSSIPLSKLPGKPPFEMGKPERSWNDVPELPSGTKTPLTPDADLAGIRRWLDYNAGKQNPVDIARMAFLDEATLAGEMEVAELFRIDLPVDGNTEAKATQLTKSFYPHRAATYSPDGRAILFSSRPPSVEHPDFETEKSAIWSLDPVSLSEKPLISANDYSFGSAEYTHDGRHIILLGMRNDQPTYRQTMLAQADADGSHLAWLTTDGDPAVQQFRVTESNDVYFDRSFHGGVRLEKLSLKSKASEIVVDGPVGVSAMDASASSVVYALIAVPDPNELFVRYRGTANGSRQANQITQLNTDWLKDKELATPEEHWITRPDGTKVQYWVMKPTHAVAGKKYPWVLDMHGGPSAMWGPGELSMWHEFQLFCSFGYGVVYANPRGSSGYGYEFQRANYKDWGDGPAGDVLASLDDAAAHDPSIDKDRLFLTGGSYAGYLTAWIIGHDQRFKAAAAQRGVYDLATFFGEGNAYRLVPNEFGGYPWQPEVKRRLDRQSPITYVENIHTPFLIIHGSNDNRTGFVQSQMLFRALREMGRPVEYIRYPGATHELTRSGEPRQRIDHMLRIVEFFERYSHNDRPTPHGATPANSGPDATASISQ